MPDLPEDRKINSCRITRALYSEQTWKQDLVKSMNLIQNHRSQPPTPAQGQRANDPLFPADSQRSQNNSFNTAISLFCRYKDDFCKYGGGITEFPTESIEEYDAVATALRLRPDQKLDFLLIILKRDARRHFKNVARNDAQTCDDAIASIKAKFSTPAQQTRIKNYLNSIKFDKFASGDIALPDTLTKLIAEIDRFFPQVPQSF